MSTADAPIVVALAVFGTATIAATFAATAPANSQPAAFGSITAAGTPADQAATAPLVEAPAHFPTGPTIENPAETGPVAVGSFEAIFWDAAAAGRVFEATYGAISARGDALAATSAVTVAAGYGTPIAGPNGLPGLPYWLIAYDTATGAVGYAAEALLDDLRNVGGVWQPRSVTPWTEFASEAVKIETTEVDPETEYYPAGVRTARPTLTLYASPQVGPFQTDTADFPVGTTATFRATDGTIYNLGDELAGQATYVADFFGPFPYQDDRAYDLLVTGPGRTPAELAAWRATAEAWAVYMHKAMRATAANDGLSANLYQQYLTACAADVDLDLLRLSISVYERLNDDWTVDITAALALSATDSDDLFDAAIALREADLA